MYVSTGALVSQRSVPIIMFCYMQQKTMISECLPDVAEEVRDVPNCLVYGLIRDHLPVAARRVRWFKRVTGYPGLGMNWPACWPPSSLGVAYISEFILPRTESSPCPYKI